MEVYQEESATPNNRSGTSQDSIPKAIPVSQVQQAQRVNAPPKLIQEQIEMKDEAEKIVKSSVQRLQLAEKMGFDISKPKETVRLYQHAVYQSDFQEALKHAKKIAIESAQIWNKTFKKRIELAKRGEIDPALMQSLSPASEDAQGMDSKLDGSPQVASAETSPGNGSNGGNVDEHQPPVPKVIATKKILQFNNHHQRGRSDNGGVPRAERVEKKGNLMESIRNWFGKKDNSDIEERLSRAEEILSRAKGLEDAEEDCSMKSLDERMAKIEAEIQKKLET